MIHPLSPELKCCNEKVQKRKMCICLPYISVHRNRVVSTLAGIQVMRALWQIWDSLDNNRPETINDIMLPAIYISCILSVLLMITSSTATWSVYKLRMHTLNVCWWLFYTLTIFSFFNACTSLSIICLGKKNFISGCLTETENAQREGCGKLVSEDVVGTEYNTFDISKCNEALAVPNFQVCRNHWQSSVIWSAVVVMLDLLINLVFAYVLYRCRVKSQLELHQSNISTGNQVHPAAKTSSKIYYLSDGTSSSSSDSDEFQTVEFK